MYQYVPDPELDLITPFQRYGHTAVDYGSNIYLWGGRNDEAVCHKLFYFDTEIMAMVPSGHRVRLNNLGTSPAA